MKLDYPHVILILGLGAGLALLVWHHDISVQMAGAWLATVAGAMGMKPPILGGAEPPKP